MSSLHLSLVNKKDTQWIAMLFVQESTLQDHNLKLKCNRIQNFQKQFEIFNLKVFGSK